MKRKSKPDEKVRVTLDLSPTFYERLTRLEEMVDLDTKAGLLRQALQLYEYVVTKSLEGYTFRLADPEGKEEKLVFFDIPRKPSSP